MIVKILKLSQFFILCFQIRTKNGLKHQMRQSIICCKHLIYNTLNYKCVKLRRVHGRVFLFVVFVQYWFH